MENWKATIFLITSAQGLLLSLALLSPFRKGDKSNIFLGLILWVIALEILSAWGMRVNYFNSPNSFHYYLLGSYLILPPSVWLFVQINTNPDFQVSKKHLLLFIPALVETIVELGMHFYMHYSGIFISMLNFKVWLFFTEIVPIVAMVFVLFLYGKRLAYFSSQLKVVDASQTQFRSIKLYGFFFFLCILTLLWAAGVLFDAPIFGFIELILSMFLFILGYIGYFNPNFFDMPKLLQDKKNMAVNFPYYDDQKELARLKQVLLQESIYTRSKLSLEELALELKRPPRYTSHLINTYHGTNFQGFINGFRVEEVIRKINDPAEQHKTLLALALEAGFNSKSTFNYVFKKHTGKSPSQYLLYSK